MKNSFFFLSLVNIILEKNSINFGLYLELVDNKSLDGMVKAVLEAF